MLSICGAILLLVILNKTGLLTKLANGELFHEGQDNYEANKVTY